MEKLLIEFNEENFKSEISSIQDIAELIKDATVNYESLKVGTFTKEDFKPLFFNTENFIFEKIMKDVNPEINGIKINRRKFWDEFAIKPQGYFDVIASVERVKKQIDIRQRHNKNEEEPVSHEVYFSFFELHADRSIGIKQTKIDSIKSKYQKFIESDKAKAAYTMVKKIADIINENKNVLGFYDKRKVEIFLQQATKFQKGMLEVNTDFIRSVDVLK